MTNSEESTHDTTMCPSWCPTLRDFTIEVSMLPRISVNVYSYCKWPKQPWIAFMSSTKQVWRHFWQILFFRRVFSFETGILFISDL